MGKSLRHLLIYITIMVAVMSILTIVMTQGQSLNSEAARGVASEASHPEWLEMLKNEVSRNLALPLTSLLIQLLTILAFSRICGRLASAIGQPKVVGEMVAGILLGKSVLAYFWPDGFAYLFPEAAMPRLYILSQIGLVFFMFVVGLELNVKDIKNRASAATLISHVSIVFPFTLGTILALFLYKNYSPQNIAFSSFALFIGVAMSITAFPVLARIIQERQLTGTPLGVMAITCAAVDDVSAWCLLAAVLGVVKAGTFITAFGILILSIVYVVAMIKIVKPALTKLLRPSIQGSFAPGQFAMVFCVVIGSAVISEVIGIHALFGAFLAGTIMPKSESFRHNLVEKIEVFSSVVLLPLFFTFTGIRTQIGLLDDLNAWMVCFLIIAVAIVGKFIGSSVAARWSGMDLRESLALGALMNTRGLMELIVLNIGYDLGILTPKVFSMFVLMALVTTFATGPLLTVFLSKDNSYLRRAGSALK